MLKSPHLCVLRFPCVCTGLFAGLSIGLPPLLHFGTKAQQEKVCGPCLMGEKVQHMNQFAARRERTTQQTQAI